MLGHISPPPTFKAHISYITDVILLFDLGEDVEGTPEGDHYPIADGINAWLRERYDGEELRYLSEAASGGKGFQAVLYAGCFNFFESEPFVDFLRTCSWQEPAHVQLLFKAEEEYRFTLVELSASPYADN